MHPTIRPLADIERDHCLRAVEQQGSIVRAAKAHGIGKNTLYRKLPEWRRQASEGMVEVVPQLDSKIVNS